MVSYPRPLEVLRALFDLCFTLGRCPSHVKDPCFDPGVSRSATQHTSAAIHPSISGDTEAFASMRYLNPGVSLAGGPTTTQNRLSTGSLPSYLQIREEPTVISIRPFGDCFTALSPHRQPDPLKGSFCTGLFLRLALCSTRRTSSSAFKWQLDLRFGIHPDSDAAPPDSRNKLADLQGPCPLSTAGRKPQAAVERSSLPQEEDRHYVSASLQPFVCTACCVVKTLHHTAITGTSLYYNGRVESLVNSI